MRERASLLPARRVRLIGRDAELRQIHRMLEQGYERLVTLTGAAGSGKTTLALEAARAVSDVDGVWLVDLALVTDPGALAQVCCDALGLVVRDAGPFETLAGYLRPLRSLVALDNCEHLAAEVAALVDRLLDACPELRVLATSRMPLRVRGEAVFVVPPLELPERDGDPAEDLRNVASVALFAERAAAVDPYFTLDGDQGRAVASICRRVDGLPLAIELAAAHVSALSAVEIDANLASEPAFLGNGAPRSPARQRTMEATLDWSHALLAPAEQALFRRLAVFAGGWTLEAARQACARPGPELDVAPLLVRLVDQSLVVREPKNGGTRFRFLAPIAEYARARLEASGERGAVSLAHAGYYLALASARSAGTVHARPEDLDRIAIEYDNVVAALRWAEQAGSAPVASGLSMAMLEFWRVRGLLRSGSAHLEAAATLLRDERSRARATIVTGLANYLQLLGEYRAATERACESLQLWTELDDGRGIRTAHAILGDVAAAEGDYERARAEYRRAWEYLSEADRTARGFWLANVGSIALHEDALDEAETRLDQARTEFGSGAPNWYLGRVLCQLGGIARRREDPHRAARLLSEGLEWLRLYGARIEAVTCLEELGHVAVQRRAPARAVTLFAAAERHRDASSLGDDVDLAAARQDLARARGQLSTRSFQAAWSRGWGMSLEDAIDFALSQGADTAGPAAPAHGPGMLTKREREIAHLVAIGLTNPQIAERLKIAPGTVRIHVERILDKLGLTSRVQVATWVVTDSDHETAQNDGLTRTASRL